MKPETKLKLRKWALMALRSIVWTVDEWLHARELRLREDLLAIAPRSGEDALASIRKAQSPVANAAPSRGTAHSHVAIEAEHAGVHAAGAEEAQCTVPVDSKDVPAARLRSRETFQQWEARRSGIAVVSKKSARRRGMPARAFDLRFAR